MEAAGITAVGKILSEHEVNTGKQSLDMERKRPAVSSVFELLDPPRLNSAAPVLNDTQNPVPIFNKLAVELRAHKFVQLTSNRKKKTF